MFWNKKVKDSAKKVDKMITWLIVWTAVASMVWLSRTEKWKKITNKMWKGIKKGYDKSKWVFWNFLVWVINFFKKK